MASSISLSVLTAVLAFSLLVHQTWPFPVPESYFHRFLSTFQNLPVSKSHQSVRAPSPLLPTSTAHQPANPRPVYSRPPTTPLQPLQTLQTLQRAHLRLLTNLVSSSSRRLSFADGLLSCIDASQCQLGETCALVDHKAGKACVSMRARLSPVDSGLAVFDPSAAKSPAPPLNNSAAIPFFMGQEPEDLLDPSPETPAPTGETSLDPSSCCNNGYSFDLCRSDADCREKRFCKYDVTATCTSRTESCFCWPRPARLCYDNSHCSEGEVCAGACPSGEECSDLGTVCVSEEIVNNFDDFREVGGGTAETSGNSSPDDIHGYNFDLCASDEDCRDARVCLAIDGKELTPCTEPRLVCFCSLNEEKVCIDSSQCDQGELCAQNPNATVPLCVSKLVVNSTPGFTETGPQAPSPPSASPVGTSTTNNEENPSAVCIDASALIDIPRHQLLFKEHALGHVLCDRFGSCATGGHMVVFNGRAMMMRTYCDMVRCERREMFVNSPRYQMGWRVASRTEGLEYTAFAARWETQFEEYALVTAIHAGL